MADGKHSQSEPTLDELIDAQGRRKVDPRGYREGNLPRFTTSRVPHNPYNAMLAVASFALLGVFLLVKLWPSWLGVALFVFFVGLALVSGFFLVRRIPAWHRARRVARAHVAEHGGAMPRELRFWS